MIPYGAALTLFAIPLALCVALVAYLIHFPALHVASKCKPWAKPIVYALVYAALALAMGFGSWGLPV